MKKKIILFFSVACLAVMTAVNTQFVLNQDSPFSLEQVEALASGEDLPEVSVTCDRNGWGRCWVIENTYPFPTCKWSGYQDDYCPWKPNN